MGFNMKDESVIFAGYNFLTMKKSFCFYSNYMPVFLILCCANKYQQIAGIG